MAYRFLLEVPEAFADEAGAAVGAAGDAQIVVRRAKTNTLAYEDPYIDMTVAAHSLDVIHTVYNWLDGLEADAPEIGIILHSSERLSLTDQTRDSMIEAIRRDQPWVERSLPKPSPGAGGIAPAAIPHPPRHARESLAAEASTLLLEAPAKSVSIQALNHIAIRANDLRKAEAFYTDLFQMDVLGRTRCVNGRQEAVSSHFSWATAGNRDEVDISYLQNGPLVLAVHRAGPGVRLERSVLAHISLRLNATSFTRIKGSVLMRGYEIVTATETEFAFRDPFSVVWDLDLAGNPVFTNPLS